MPLVTFTERWRGNFKGSKLKMTDEQVEKLKSYGDVQFTTEVLPEEQEREAAAQKAEAAATALKEAETKIGELDKATDEKRGDEAAKKQTRRRSPADRIPPAKKVKATDDK